MSRFDSIEYEPRFAGLSQQFRDKFKDLLRDMELHLSFNSREKALAITKLEECSMWVNRCIAQMQKEETILHE